MVRAALRTRPRSITQRQFLVLPTTDGTQTAAREPAVCNNQLGAIALGLIFHLRAEHPKAHVADGASKPLVRQHASDV